MFMCTSVKCNTCFSLIFFQVCGFLFPFNVAGGKSAGTDSYESRIVGHIIKIPRNSLRYPSPYLSLYVGPCQSSRVPGSEEWGGCGVDCLESAKNQDAITLLDSG